MRWPSDNIENHIDRVENCNPAKMHDSEIFKYIDISSINREKKSIENVETIIGNEAPSRAKQIVKENDVLVSTVRPNLNAVSLIPKQYNKAIASTGFCVLRTKKTLDSNYLYYWVRNPTFISEMIRRSSGASYPAVSDTIIGISKIPLPPLDIQKKIAAVLDKADELRQKRKQAIAKLDELLQSVFLDMFGDPVTNPKGWPVKKLGEVVDSESNLSYGIVQPGDDVSSGVSIVRPVDLRTREVKKQHLKTINKSISDKFKRTILHGDEILLCVRGTVGTVSLASIELQESNVSRGIVPIRIDKSIVLKEFLFEQLRSKSMNNIMKSMGKGIALIQINLGELRELPLVVPDINTQLEFVEIINTIIRSKIQLHTATINTDNLFNSLLQKAFKGELKLK